MHNSKEKCINHPRVRTEPTLQPWQANESLTPHQSLEDFFLVLRTLLPQATPSSSEAPEIIVLLTALS